jgi:hypothetical protein
MRSAISRADPWSPRLLEFADGVLAGTFVGIDVAAAEDLGGPDDAAGVTLGAGLDAVQATTRRATTVAVATRVSDECICVPLGDVYQRDAGMAPGCCAGILSVCRQLDSSMPSIRGGP